MKTLFVLWFVNISCFTNFLLGQTNPLFIPPTLSGPVYDLDMQHGTYFLQGPDSSATMGYNGDILGPTLIMDAGDDITINVTNSIGEETTTHWHGLHLAPENDGGPHSVISPNQTWSPQFTVEDKASTFWYHPHLHHFTMKHVVLGLAGLIIVRDTEEAALNLPRTYGVDDFPLILQTKAMIDDSILYSTTESNNFGGNPNMDSIFFANATMDAALDAPKQINRFRILNGATHRVFNFGLSDDADFWQIGSDGGLLNDPVELNRLMLAPGERAEILVDLSVYASGESLTFKSYASELPDGYWGAEFAFNDSSSGDPTTGNPLSGVDFDMLTINVIDQTSSAVTSIPSSLVTVTPIEESTSDFTRHKYFLNGNNFCPMISPDPEPDPDHCFDINVINEVIELNQTETWVLHGAHNQYHPFHIHDIQFFILERDGSVPPLNERGLKDVVVVGPNEEVKIIGKFENFTGETPYMYHCHILPHEDRGMMGQFVVRQNIYVDKDYTGVENGTMDQPYNTIREGVDIGAATGMTLNILSTGIHNEAPPDLLMNKKVNIIMHNPPVIIE